MAELQLLAVTSLVDHPRNPRVVMRDDVIDGIVANLGDEWPQKHALHVRPVGDKYEIISGHHRKRAAEKKGHERVWCWVEEMDDHAAFMALATSNNQGELDPLEIGIHAFEAVPPAKGGRGKKGGLSEYAERIGKKQNTISEYQNAGEVASNISLERYLFLGKAKHLAAIHKLPKDCWQAVCEWLAKQEKSSVVEVKERVDAAAVIAIDPIVLSFDSYSESEIVCRSFIDGKDVAREVQRICDLVVKVKENLDDDLKEQLHKWFVEEPRFDIKEVQDKRIELESIQWERDNAAHEEEERPLVSVLLADPPWRYDFSETDSRQIENQYPTADADEIARHLDLPWAPQLADDCVLFMWATAPKLREAFVVLEGWGFEYKTHAIWDKEKIGMGYWFRGQHELLIVATRGTKSPPEPDKRFASVFRERRDDKHSKKPECVYRAIEEMFPDDVKFEMYARESREGWLQGGNDL